MGDYIERKAVIKALGDSHFKNYGNAIMVIKELPAADVADVAEVVRCGQCKEWEPGTIDERDTFNPPVCRWIGKPMHSQDFCSYGEREEAEEKTCGTCKHFQPDNEWPCVDCDMSIHDRWEG